MSICSISECEGSVVSRGWCDKHYSRWKRYRDPLKVKQIHGDDLARFNKYTNKTPMCWLWVGYGGLGGYGQLSVGGKMVSAHRFSYEQFIGPIPDGMCVLHSCDTPMCVNPEHLSIGTLSQNTQQMLSRQRHNVAKGEGSGRAKLTTKEVLEIRQAHTSRIELAARYGVCTTQIGLIQRRKSWKHIPEETV